jgi:GntR family transcriptional regulator/MocR family aminotransferase
MQFSINRGNGLPVYEQIAARLRAAIETGELRRGERLPTIRELAQSLGVNRDTVQLAYDALAAAGFVEAGVGRGTFVAESGSAVQRNAEPERSEPFAPALSALTERLLAFERARPRFGNASDAVPLHAMVPDPALYPVDEFRRSLSRVLRDEGAQLLTYGGPEGRVEMRAQEAARLRRAGVEVSDDEVVLCHGASQGITLALRLFAEPGDVIALEEPTYNNVLASVYGCGLRTAPVPMREEGPDLAALERLLSRPEVKAFYTIPSFHNPTGITTSLAARRELLAVAARCGKPVIEDGYELDLAWSGPVAPPLAALDASGIVVHLSSYSKSLFPGARMGSISARGPLVEALHAQKRATDHSDAMCLQAALADFVAAGAYQRHLAKLLPVLRARCEAMCDALAEMPEGTRYVKPIGGLQVWVELPGQIDTHELLADAARAGVLFAPGSQFFHDGRRSRALRLCIALADEASIRRGIAALASVVRARTGSESRPRAAVHI